MKALYLYDDTCIEIDPRSMDVGAGWGVRLKDNMPEAGSRGKISSVLDWLKRQHDPVVVDVGAGTGHLSMLPIFHPTVVFHAFEPNLVHVEVLQANLELHNIQDRVTVYPVALLDSTGSAVLTVPAHPKRSGCGTLGTCNLQPGVFDGGQVYDVETRTLDSYAFERVDLLKLDVEGAELSVLKGAAETIERCKPAVIFEWSRTSWFGYPWHQIMELLMKHDYRKFRAITGEDMWAEPCTPAEARELP